MKIKSVSDAYAKGYEAALNVALGLTENGEEYLNGYIEAFRAMKAFPEMLELLKKKFGK